MINLQPREVELSALQPDTFFDFSWAADRELRLEQAEKYAALPMIVIGGNDNSILGGYDFYRLFQARGAERVTVLAGEPSKEEALCLNFNISNALFSLNLLEKLRFTQRILTVLDPPDIYRRVDLDISINKKLREHMDKLLVDKFRYLLSHDLVNLKTALRICDLEEADRKSVIELFGRIPFTSSQCLHILEILEEIRFRDKMSVKRILEEIGIETFFQKKKPQPALLEALVKRRYPLYSHAEEEWKARVKSLNLPGNVKVSHTPFFEKKNIEVTTSLENFEQLEIFSMKIVAK
jgi:hypothetical protein